jgi:hypothetical protein
MAHSVGDSMAVLANLVPGRHRGASCACLGAASRVVALESLSDRRPYTNSRAWLTGDRKLHSGRRGDVLSTWVPTLLGMALQCLNSWHSAGHGRTGPEAAEVMEEMRSAGLTSRHHPGRAQSWWSYPFRGYRCPLSSGATWRRHGSGWHSVTERHWPSRTTPGMAAQCGLVEQCRDLIPMWCQRIDVVGIRL